MLFFLNYLVISNYPVTFRPIFHILIWSVYLIIFYLNLLILLPGFFFRKKILIYIISSLILIGAGNFATYEVRRTYFSRLEFERSQRTGRVERSENIEIRPENPGRLRDNVRPFNPRSRNYQRRNILFSLSGIVLIFTLSFAFGILQRYEENEKIRLQTEKEKIETELNALKKQVNPHFLFNSLNNIYALANRRSNKTTEAVLKLSEILRYMIYDAEKSVVSLQQEFNSLLSYIELQKLKLTEKTKLKIEIKMPTVEYMIEPLLLLPLVENAFKHGSDNVNDSIISIKASADDGKLSFFCSNTLIPGLKELQKAETSGIGIKNVKRRLEILYPDNHNFIIKEKDNTFNVNLTLILKT